jgi:hypothetical protein
VGQQARGEGGQLGLWLTAAGLCILGILTRIPFQSQILHEYDSVQFALALDNFDIRLHQPHPPGMFVFYILLGRLFRLFLHDANTSLVWLSTVAAGLAIAELFVIGSFWFNRTVGVATAIIALTSPLVWFQGEVALSYMLEFCWVLPLVLACYHLRSGHRIDLFVAAAMLGLSGGIRPNTAVFLFPLWAIAVGLGWRDGKFKWQDCLAACSLVGIGILSWLIPLVMMSGGPLAAWNAFEPWLEAHPKDGLGRSFLGDGVSSLQGTYLNFKQVLEAILYGVGFASIPTLWVVHRDWTQIRQRLRHDWRGQLMLAWLLPGLFYLIFIHIQRAGHTFTIVPVLILMAGVGVVRAGRHLALKQASALAILVAAIALGNGLFFLFGPANLDTVPSWHTLREYDLQVQERLQAIRDRFPPDRTVVLTESRNARVRGYYLGDYVNANYLYQPTEQPEPLDPNVRHLVWFDREAPPDVETVSDLQQLELPTSGTLPYVSWGDGERAILSQSSFRLEKIESLPSTSASALQQNKHIKKVFDVPKTAHLSVPHESVSET